MTNEQIKSRIKAIATEIWAIECSYDILTQDAKNRIAALNKESGELYKALEV